MKKKTKKSIETLEKRWTASKAKIFRRRTQRGTEAKQGTVGVVELGNSLQIPPDRNPKEPYGIPIDAKLAINLISDFHSLLPEPFLNKFINDDDIIFNFADKKDQDAIVNGIYGLIEILRRSCAITIDKNVLLKTLSQPGCEGLRFYLCKKNAATQDFISLVTVGVDIDGKDHLYDYVPSNNNKAQAQNIQPMSLISEYGHPPGSTKLNNKKLNDVYTESYALLNYALDITKSKKK